MLSSNQKVWITTNDSVKQWKSICVSFYTVDEKLCEYENCFGENLKIFGHLECLLIPRGFAQCSNDLGVDFVQTPYQVLKYSFWQVKCFYVLTGWIGFQTSTSYCAWLFGFFKKILKC